MKTTLYYELQDTGWSDGACWYERKTYSIDTPKEVLLADYKKHVADNQYGSEVRLVSITIETEELFSTINSHEV